MVKTERDASTIEDQKGTIRRQIKLKGEEDAVMSDRSVDKIEEQQKVEGQQVRAERIKQS